MVEGPPALHFRYLPSTAEELAELYQRTRRVLTDGSVYDRYAVPTELRAQAQRASYRHHLYTSERILDPELRERTCVALRQRIAELREPEEEPGTAIVSTTRMRGIVEHMVADQVVVVRGATRLARLQEELAKTGQSIPFRPPEKSRRTDGFAALDSINHLIGYNLPHLLEAHCGSWRDWILGMTVVLADGTIAKCGSQVVKSVAGYDVQKLFVGARGTLGTIVEVTLRTFSLKALPPPEGSSKGEWDVTWVQRVRRSDFAQALAGARDRVRACDPETGTLWFAGDGDLSRYPYDWVLRRNCGQRNLEISDPVQIGLMRKAKALFDPDHKLNPGAMGIF